MDLGDQGYFVFQAGEELIIIVQEFEVKFNTLSDAFIPLYVTYPVFSYDIG